MINDKHAAQLFSIRKQSQRFSLDLRVRISGHHAAGQGSHPIERHGLHVRVFTNSRKNSTDHPKVAVQHLLRIEFLEQRLARLNGG